MYISSDPRLSISPRSFVGFLTLAGKALIDEGAHSGCDSAKRERGREGGRKCHDPVGDTEKRKKEMREFACPTEMERELFQSYSIWC